MKFFLQQATHATGSVNLENGSIEGVSLISTPEAKGHNIKIDDASIQSFFEAVEGKTIKAYYTHSPSNDALDSIGLWSNFRIHKEEEYTKLLGDFKALDAWKENDEKSFAMLFELATKAPEAFGVSAEFEARAIVYGENGEEKEYDAEEDSNLDVFARAVNVSAFSIVAQPAANPTGLFAEAKEQEQNLASTEEKESLEMELSQTIKTANLLDEQNKQLQKDIDQLNKEKKEVEENLNAWKVKYAETISNMGADPVDSQIEDTPKTFEEKLASCQSYSEKSKLIKQSMPELMATWNK
jgi:Spy/CpxP family protein refolding chaperone